MIYRKRLVVFMVIAILLSVTVFLLHFHILAPNRKVIIIAGDSARAYTIWLKLTFILSLGVAVVSGCRKSRRFHNEFQKYSDDQKKTFLSQLSKEGYLMQRARFWEAGAVTKLPPVFAAIGYALAALALLVILFYFVVIVYGIMH